jgi:hypothetical protein
MRSAVATRVVAVIGATAENDFSTPSALYSRGITRTNLMPLHLVQGRGGRRAGGMGITPSFARHFPQIPLTESTE